jgi:hypothetical protein
MNLDYYVGLYPSLMYNAPLPTKWCYESFSYLKSQVDFTILWNLTCSKCAMSLDAKTLFTNLVLNMLLSNMFPNVDASHALVDFTRLFLVSTWLDTWIVYGTFTLKGNRWTSWMEACSMAIWMLLFHIGTR